MKKNDVIQFGADKKNLIKQINENFGENHKNFDDVTYEDLLWYIECLFLWSRLNTEYYKKKIKEAKTKNNEEDTISNANFLLQIEENAKEIKGDSIKFI